MTADQNGLVTSKKDNNPPPNSSAVVTGAHRWSPLQTDLGTRPAAFTDYSRQQQGRGSGSTVVSGFGVYSNPSSRTVTTSHIGQQGHASVLGSVHSSALPMNLSTSAHLGCDDGTNPTSEPQRANLQAFMSQLTGSMPLSGSNTASTTFLKDPNTPVAQILMGIDNAASAGGVGAPHGTAGGTGDGQFSHQLPFSALNKVHSGTIIDKNDNGQVKDGKLQEERKNIGDGGNTGKAYGLRDRKVKLPEELLRDEADENKQGERPAAVAGPAATAADDDDAIHGEFKKGVDQDGDLTDEFDDDDDLEDEFNEEGNELGKGKGASKKKTCRRFSSKASSPSAAAAVAGGSRKQQQQDGNDAPAGLQAHQEQQQDQGGIPTIINNKKIGDISAEGMSMLPAGHVGRPRGYAGDPDFASLGEEDRRRLKRRIANRESARRVRAKRQEMMDELQQKITALSHQNARLLAHIATAEQSRQSLQSQLSIIRERFAGKLQENTNLLTECAALRHALQEKGINPADAIANLVKHAQQQQQQQQQQQAHGNGNHTNAGNDASNAIARASSLLQANGGAAHRGIPNNGGASAFLPSAFNSMPCSTQEMLNAFSAPLNVTQPATSVAAAAAAAAAAATAMLPPVTSAGMAPTLTGFNLG
jgi:hypothetical protein